MGSLRSSEKDRLVAKLSFSFGGRQQPLSPGALSPELLERLREGGDLTAADWALLRRAAVTEGSVEAGLLSALLRSGLIGDGVVAAEGSVAQAADGTTIITSPTTVHEWRHDPATAHQPAPVPRTYYEALTGRPHPATDRLISVGRSLHLLVTLLAIGLPIGLTALMISLGESLETIVFVAVGASIVGLMLRSTFPRLAFD
jgi:hypothetical protein